MSTVFISGILLRELFMNGYRNLKRNKETVNSLNVFPVPDGDTGTNMTATFAGGFSAPECEDISEYMKAFSRGALMSARGNSGVILSQFIRGFALGVEGMETINATQFANAVANGVDFAYKSVLKPVEGTMLTVLREAAECIKERKDSFVNFNECMSVFCAEMKRSLARTPEMLPVLKEAEVIDSGGAGVLCIFEGVNMALSGEFLTDEEAETDRVHGDTLALSAFDSESEFEYGYCTEFILQLLSAKCDVLSFDSTAFAKGLETLGESIVCVSDGGIVKVHIHSFDPEKVLEYGRRYGEFLTVKIENMSVQHNETIAKDKKPDRVKFAFVAAASGDGIKSYFKEIGVNEIVDGGQTRNPSTEDFIEAFSKINAEYIIVLPNNSNIILTAQLAAEMYKDSDVRVIKTKSIADGYSALSMMDPFATNVEELIDSMTSCLDGVTTGYVTVASRDSHIGGIEVHIGEYIGLDSDSILSAENDKVSAVVSLLKNLEDIDDKQVVTVFYGNDVSDGELEKLRSKLEEEFPLIDTAFINGGQNIYSFIMSIE